FKPGSHVLRIKAVRKGKLDHKYTPERFLVVAAFANRTYLLANESGRLLKRR
ncbi:hypothetical protein BDB00DRAFT_742805, partial [Zychaea mexicana]|uniref:uncharacterized protein n=1 Tax=Zychaea mexicana TaxID=64656 RepID=UPI0022FE38ED